jgi:hypothetical protein
MNEPVLYPADARQTPNPPPQLLRPRRSSWTGGLLWLLALGLAVIVALVLLANTMPMHFPPPNISVNGDELHHGWDAAQMPPAHEVALAAVMLVALLAAVIIVPLALVVVVATVVCVALLIIGLPLLAVLMVLGLALSPLLLLGWLLWKLVSA